MSRESAALKARRLLVEGRVRVLSANEDDGYVSAEVRGDSARVYAVSYEAGDGGWRCDCPTRGACSHVRAVQLICVVEPRKAPA
jgi:uncharacterized Zn finger protein